MISGRAFAEACQWVVDPRYPDLPAFNYDAASTGNRVFVNGDYVADLAEHVSGLGFKKFIFVVHNSDHPLRYQAISALSRYALRIYAINAAVRHPLLKPIPIGFIDKHLPLLRSLKVPDGPRDIEIYGNFSLHTNATKRNDCHSALKDDPRVAWTTNRTVPEYYEDLCRSKFVLCPEGTGMDTHRVYEALLCGATPVVLRNALYDLYSKLPVCIVEKWTDPFHAVPGTFSTDIADYL